MRCPNCGYDNIPGIDLCEVCGSDLAGLDLPESHLGFRGRLLTGRIGDLPLAPPDTVSADTNLDDAIRAMRDHKHGSLMVEDNGKLTGIFTERDVLTRMVRPGKTASSLKVSDVMTSRPVTLDVNDPPAFAIHLSVARGLRHLPVLEDDQLKGLVSVRDLLRHIHEDVLGS